MIAQVWAEVTDAMGELGFVLDPSEGTALSDRHYTIKLPQAVRDSEGSTIARARVVRDIRIRLQFRERRDANFQRAVAEEIEKVVVAMRGARLLFEASSLKERGGGLVAEIEFSARDSMN